MIVGRFMARFPFFAKCVRTIIQIKTQRAVLTVLLCDPLRLKINIAYLLNIEN
jgi:hypothetical protein